MVLDARTIQDHFPGIGRYTFNLALALANAASGDELVLLYDSAQVNTRYDMSRFSLKPHVEIVEAPVRNFAISAQWQIPALLKSLHADIYHSPYFIMPFRTPMPTVVTVHDLIPMLYPAYFKAHQRFAFNVAMRLASRTARLVVAVSEASAADVRRLLHVDSRKVRAVLSAADPSLVRPDDAIIAETRERYGLPASYVLYVGSNKPHKNLKRLVEAWPLVKRRAQSQLVIAGAWDPFYNAPKITAAHLGLENDIRWLGSFPQSDLAALYSGSDLFVFPSEYEGFGLPVIEAMACGVPVICSNSSSLPEVAGDSAILVDPHESKAWADAIDRLLADADLRAAYAQRSLHQAQRFSWAETARRMRALYEQALELW